MLPNQAFMPTVVELSEAEYPQEADGNSIYPMEGVSLVSAFKGKSQRGEHPLYWDYIQPPP